MTSKLIIASVAFGGFLAGVASVTSCSTPNGGATGLTISLGTSSTTLGETSATAGELEDTCTRWQVTAHDHFDALADGQGVELPAGEFPFAAWTVNPGPILTRRCLD